MYTNPNLAHHDPRKEIVDRVYLCLASNLIFHAQQNENYWASVPVPLRPTNRVDYQELRQIAVFLPMILVVLAFNHFHSTGAIIAFLTILPLMKLQHDLLTSAIAVQVVAWHRRDCGRYAFTVFMSEKFGLLPEEVTMPLVLKMCRDLVLVVDAADRVVIQKTEAGTNTHIVSPIKTSAGDQVVPANGGRHTIRSDVSEVARSNVHAGLTIPNINPITGLPMINSGIDVQGNIYGTNSCNDVFEHMCNEHAVDPYINTSETDFNSPEFGASGLDAGGFGVEL